MHHGIVTTPPLVAYGGIRRGRIFFLSMLKNFVRIRTYDLYDKHTLGTR